jgi:hypothetical protein
MEEGKIKRSDIYLATKVNMMGLGTYPCGERSGPHSYDTEIVMHACKVLLCSVSPQHTRVSTYLLAPPPPLTAFCCWLCYGRGSAVVHRAHAMRIH